MASYTFRDADGDITTNAPEFEMPKPVHAQTKAARLAVKAMLRDGATRRLDRAMQSIVTDHQRPAERRTGAPPVTANARKLDAAARRTGFETKILEYAEACVVEGWHPQRRVGFRATWERGRASTASWHEPWRYAIVGDDRPVKMSKRTRTGLKGARSAGMGATRLELLGSPLGLPVTHTELTERINA